MPIILSIWHNLIKEKINKVKENFYGSVVCDVRVASTFFTFGNKELFLLYMLRKGFQHSIDLFSSVSVE